MQEEFLSSPPINARCGDSGCLSSIDFVSGSDIEI